MRTSSRYSNGSGGGGGDGGHHLMSANRRELLLWLADTRADINAHGVPIGRHGTRVPEAVLRKELYVNYRKTLRIIMRAVFSRVYLATHTLTGSRSPRSVDYEQKEPLDPDKLADIVAFLVRFTGAPECDIREGITIHCNDEQKWYKNQLIKERMSKFF